jgi:maltooligosyltrehalose trehalohydrolase
LTNTSLSIESVGWPLGAHFCADGRTSFLVWAPQAKRVSLVLREEPPRELTALADGYFAGLVENAPPGTLYKYSLDGNEPLPDPASRFQPQGVFGPSMVVDARLAWTAENPKRSLSEYVVYELHVGTYTAAGTFAALLEHLPRLAELGVNAIELMPIAQFSGKRNWGYDGVFPFATQNTYGTPNELRTFVNECHHHGLSVILDVVYNHLGPEGNCLAEYGPYFTKQRHTPWGPAVNFDGEQSTPVRRYFLENAEYWLKVCGFDALRLDAVHAICDDSPQHILAELQQRLDQLCAELGRPMFAIAESNQNIAKLVQDQAKGGYGLAAQWVDDFQRSLHSLLTGEQAGYYIDYGQVEQLALSYQHGFVFTGQYSQYRKRPQGEPCEPIPLSRFLACVQNHDAVGNRMLGERLCQLVEWRDVKLAAVATLLSPFIPLIFMGEEYAETAPFLYFVDHQSGFLRRQTREGRLRDFAAFLSQGRPSNPANEKTFLRSKLHHELIQTEKHGALWHLYRQLLAIRREYPVWRNSAQGSPSVAHANTPSWLTLRWEHDRGTMQLALNFAEIPVTHAELENTKGYEVLFDSSALQWRLPDEPETAAPTLGFVPAKTALLLWRPR